MHRQYRIKQVGESNSLSLGYQAKERTVAVKAPRPTLFHQFQTRFVVAIEQLVGYLAASRFVREFKCLRAVPLDSDDRHQRIGDDAAYSGIRLELF